MKKKKRTDSEHGILDFFFTSSSQDFYNREEVSLRLASKSFKANVTNAKRVAVDVGTPISVSSRAKLGHSAQDLTGQDEQVLLTASPSALQHSFVTWKLHIGRCVLAGFVNFKR